jgi:hypothetical protein
MGATSEAVPRRFQAKAHEAAIVIARRVAR